MARCSLDYGLIACGNPVMLSGNLSELPNPDRTCKKIACNICSRRLDLHKFRPCHCGGDFELMWCEECRDGFPKCRSCDMFFCPECIDQQETNKYGLLCFQCSELMCDIDDELKAELYPPERIRIGLGYIPFLGSNLPVEKLYAEVNGMTEERAQRIREIEQQIEARGLNRIRALLR